MVSTQRSNTCHSPILYRTFYLLTPPSELPPLPQSLHKATRPALTADQTPPGNPSYLPIHLYTILQIATTVIIFIVTLTRGAPAFPVLIIALVPFRLLVMKRWWPREALRFVDAWACREGTPEDDEDAQARDNHSTVEEGPNPGEDGLFQHDSDTKGDGLSTIAERRTHVNQASGSRADIADQEVWGMTDDDMNHEWVELGERSLRDEELGRDR